VNPNLVSALTGYFPYLGPEMILGGAACVLFLGGTWRANRNLWGGVALLALIVAGLVLWVVPLPTFGKDAADAAMYSSPVLLDRLALFVRAISIVAGIILVLFSWEAMPEDQAADYHSCILLIVAGIGLTGAANELITLFLALELTSIPTYIILYLGRSAQPGGGLDAPAQEAAMKYFLLSVFSSALTLFGFSYLYGLAGTTNLPALADAFRANQLSTSGNPSDPALTGMGTVALVLVVAGLGFRLTAVPFHFYAPDVYQGTTTAAAGLLAFVPKAAGFAALVRVLGFVMPTLSGDVFEARMSSAPVLGDQLPVLLWIMAFVTMTLGNVLGLLQDNLRRLLAYSSVAHAGYMLIGLAVAPKLVTVTRSDLLVDGVDAVFFYLVAYGAMTVGAFGVLEYLHTLGQRAETVDDLAGLSRSRPGVALLMVLFLFSLIGIPLTVGFMGKFLLFAGALDVPASADVAASLEQRKLFIWLALIGALNAAIGGWYYLRVAAAMYLREPPPTAPTVAGRTSRRSWPVLASVWLCALLTLGLGIYPVPLKKAVQSAVPRYQAFPGRETAQARP
jgi:NADH-quinone oxidoreductase subunit N